MKVIAIVLSSLSSLSILLFSIFVCFSVFSNADSAKPLADEKTEYIEFKSTSNSEEYKQ